MTARRQAGGAGLAILLVLISLAGAAAAEACPRTSLPAIENEVMCPICGTPLSIANGPQAERERVFIRERVERCQSKQQIKTALVAEYGTAVLAKPQTRGFSLTAYLAPVVAGILAVLALGLGVARWRRERPDQTGIDTPASGTQIDASRLETDLDRYDL